MAQEILKAVGRPAANVAAFAAGLSDRRKIGLIVTGQRTSDSADPEELALFRSASPLPVLVGSGVTQHNVTAIFEHADAVIVASSLKIDGVWWNDVDPARVRQFMKTVAQVAGDLASPDETTADAGLAAMPILQVDRKGTHGSSS